MKILQCKSCGGEVHSEDLSTATCLYCHSTEVLLPGDHILDLGIPEVIPNKLTLDQGREALGRSELGTGEAFMFLVPFWFLEGRYRFAYYSVAEFEHGFGASEVKQRVAREWPERTVCLCAARGLGLKLDPLSEDSWPRADLEKARPSKTWEGTRLRPELEAEEAQEVASVYFETEAREEINRDVCEVEMFRGRFEMQTYRLFYRPFYCFRKGQDQSLVDAVTGREMAWGVAPGEALQAPLESGPCPSCGSPVETPEGALTLTCSHCGVEVLIHDRTLEAVSRHGLVPLKLSMDKVRAQFPKAVDWKLSYLPFWSLKGRFVTDYLAHHFEENLFRAKFRRERKELVDAKTTVLVPAGSFANHGLTWEAATSLKSVEFPKLSFPEVDSFQANAIAEDAQFEHATKAVSQATETATEVIGWVQRDSLHSQFEELEIMGSNSEVTESCLLHVPVYEAREPSSGKRVLVEAHGGQNLAFTPLPNPPPHKSRPKYFYVRLLIAVVLSVGGNLAARHWWITPDAVAQSLLLTLIPQLMALQMFTFVAKDPRSILEAENIGSISVFNPLLYFYANRPGLRGVVFYFLLLCAASFSPLLILLSPVICVGYPFARAIYYTMTAGKSFWKVFKHELWEMVLFCVRTGALLFVGGILLWGVLWALWSCLAH